MPHFKFLKKRSHKGNAEVHHALARRCCTRAATASRSARPIPTRSEFWADLTQCYREEIADLYKAGCRYLQIDDTTIAMFGDPKVQEQFRKLGDDPKKDVAIYAEAVNAGDPRRARRHDGRRSTPAAATSRAPGSRAAATTTSPRPRSRRIDVDGFFLEFDDERSGGFEPLRYVAEGQEGRARPGVAPRWPQLEKKDQLKRRIEQASKFVPLENLCLSPQCGFSSTHHGNNLTVEQEKAKLKLCIDTAKEVWGSL